MLWYNVAVYFTVAKALEDQAGFKGTGGVCWELLSFPQPVKWDAGSLQSCLFYFLVLYVLQSDHSITVS